MFSIETRVNWRAAHRLLPPYEGKCNNVHGEYYTGIFIFKREFLNEDGMVVDFSFVKNLISDFIDIAFDHAYLYKIGDDVGEFLSNKGFKIFSFQNNPTAEIIAKFLYEYFNDVFSEVPYKLVKVGIIESSETNIAWYEYKG